MRSPIPELPHEFTEGMAATTDHSLLISAAAYLGTYLNGSLDFSTPPDDMKLKLYSEASYAAAVVGQGAFATARTYGERWRQALGNAGTTFIIGAAALAEIAYGHNESPGLDDFISLGGASGVAFATSMLLSLKHHLAARQQLKEEVAYAVARQAAQEKGKATELLRSPAERPIIASDAEGLRALLDAMEYTYAMDLVRMRVEEFPEAARVIYNAAKYQYLPSNVENDFDLPAGTFYPRLVAHDRPVDHYNTQAERYSPWVDLLIIPASNVSEEKFKRLQSAYTSLYPDRTPPREWKEPIRCGVDLNGTTHYPRTDRITDFKEVWYYLRDEAYVSGDKTDPPVKTAEDVLSYLVWDQWGFYSNPDTPSRPRDTTSLRRVRDHYRQFEPAQAVRF